jgi:hypothetical protein
MASPFSFGDLVRAIELFEWVRKNCIDPKNNAQGKYQQFRRDIDVFAQGFNDFQDVFLRAIGHINDLDPLAAVSRYEALRQKAGRLIKELLETLKDCKDLLNKHIKLDSQRAKFLDNLFFSASTQDRVEELRQRIRDHADMISLLVQELTLQLTTETASRTREIRNRLAGSVENTELPNLASAFDSKLRQALARARHPTIPTSDPSQIPPKEGIDMMLFHYQQCTALPLGSFSKPQYLHLLKSQWLVETILRSDELKQFQPDHLYHRVVEQVRHGIAELYQREEIQRYIACRPCDFTASDFEIWPQMPVKAEQPLTDPIEHESLLATVPVGPQSPDERRELFIFRKDNQHFRIVYLRSPTDPTQRVRETETFFDLSTDRLVPFYTVTTGTTNEWNMQMFYSSGASQVDYPLQTRGDAFKLQKAFIEYETVAFSESVRCTPTYKKKGFAIRKGLCVSRGEIQLLEWPLPDSIPPSGTSPRLSGTIASTQSSSNLSRATQTFRDADPRLTSISEAVSERTVVVTALPQSPLVMAFTQMTANDVTTYTFWQIART